MTDIVAALVGVAIGTALMALGLLTIAGLAYLYWRRTCRDPPPLGPTVMVWRDSQGKAWCQFPNEPPERLLTRDEVERKYGAE